MSFIDKNNFNNINEFKNITERNINKKKYYKFLMNKIKISKTDENEKMDNELKTNNSTNNNQKKIIKRNVTNVNTNTNKSTTQKKIYLDSKNNKEEEKNFSNNIKELQLNLTDNFFTRSNNKSNTQKRLLNNNKSKNENETDSIYEYKRKNSKLRTLNLEKTSITKKNSQKSLNKKLLFTKLNDLLDEIEKENDNKEKKKNKKFKDVSYLFLERSVKPQIPNLKNRAQLNKYLINDFKENESYQDYIQRSLKYKRINENYEIAQLIQKETKHFYTLNEELPPEPNNDKDKYYLKYKNQNQKLLTFNNINNSNDKEKLKKKTTFSFLTPNSTHGTYMLKNNLLEQNSHKNISTKNFCPEIKENKNAKSQIKKRNTVINFNYNKEEKSNNNKNNLSFLQEQFLTEPPKKTFKKRKSETFSSEKAILLKTKSIFPIRHKKRVQTHKKRRIFYDKFTISNNIYNEQKKFFDDYLMNKRLIRSKNFSEQMSNLAKEKDLYRINGSESGSLPRLKEGSLIYEMKLKNLFKNSFNPMANFKEGDDDLDLDNLKKIKKSVMEMEIEMFTNLKNEINPKYIKNKFNKTTVGKYHSTRGVYFGSK